MPFFSRHSEPEEEAVPVEPTPVEEPKKHHSFFSRGRDTSPSPSARTGTTAASHQTAQTRDETASHNGSLFRRSTDASAGGRRSLLHRSFGNGNASGTSVDMDPTIVAARERVLSAEQAERDADAALLGARRAVKEAREHVRRLELEAKEEARRAKIKAYHAREVSKRGKALGRHDE